MKLILPKHLEEVYFAQHGHLKESKQDGCNDVDDVVKKHKELGMTMCCPTDHGILGGQHKLFKSCEKHGVTPNIGIEFYLIQDKYKDSKSKEYTSPLSQVVDKFGNKKFDDVKTFHCTAMVLNETGYQNLLTLNYLSNLKKEDEVMIDFEYGTYSKKPRITEKLLFKYSEGLVITSGCRLSLINTYFMEGLKNESTELLNLFSSKCENFFIELHVAHNEVEEKMFYFLKEYAFKNNIPTFVSNDYHYVSKGDLQTWNILGGLRRNLTKSNPDSIKNDDFYIKSFEEMYSRVLELNNNDITDTDKCFSGFVKFREKFDFTWKDKKAQKISFPNAEKNLKELLYSRLDMMVDESEHEVYKARLEEEIDTAIYTQNCSYYLLVEDIIRFARKKGLTTPFNRGSAGSLLILYLLGITKRIDPLRFNLIAERASNKQRKKEMDIDLDFGEKAYYQVLAYIKEKYGKENVSNIINYGYNHLSSSIRNIFRYMEYPEVTKNVIAKQINEKFTEYKYRGDEVEEIEPNIESIEELDDFINIFKSNGVMDYKNVLSMAKKIEGTINNYSVHASGILISNTPIYKKYPVQRVKDVIVSSFDMSDLSDLGALKLDLLRVSTYSKLDEAIDMYNEHHKGE